MNTIFIITEKEVEQYSQISKDRNIIHFQNKAARQIGYEKKIAHGMLVMAKVASFIHNYTCFHYYMTQFTTSFKKPVYIGDKYIITIIKDKKGSNDQRSLIYLVQNEHNDAIMKGKVSLCKITTLASLNNN